MKTGPASRDGLLAGRLVTYSLVHAVRVGTLIAAGFELLATFRRPHFTIDSVRTQRRKRADYSTRWGRARRTRTIEMYSNAETDDPDDHSRYHR
jgi:hypothetical protein